MLTPSLLAIVRELLGLGRRRRFPALSDSAGLSLAVNLASQGTLWTPDQSVKLDRGSPVTPVQHPDNALDDRPVCLQHHENLVLRTLNNGGNILLRDAPSTSWIGTA